MKQRLHTVLLTGWIMGVAACGGRMARPDAPTAQTREALTALREATRPFQDVAAAVRAGYAADVAACIVLALAFDAIIIVLTKVLTPWLRATGGRA